MRITIKDHFRETEIFLRRVVFAGFVVFALVLTVIGRLAYLQMIQHDHYTTLSQSNRIHLLPVAPNRGLILDRDGVVLAQNYPTFTLSITPERAHGVNDTLARLSEVIDLDEVDIQRFRKQLRHGRAYQTIPLRFHLSDEEVARFALDRYMFPGVELAAPLTRHYPQGELAAHVVGYVGRIDEQEVATMVDVDNYDGTNHIGKTGIEKQYEDVLHGFVGNQEVETNAQGRMIRVLNRKEPRPGTHLHLNISALLQKTAMDALGDNNGAVVAIDPQTGAVLALASKPSFDPNLFVNGIETKIYKELLTSPDQPLYNRAVNGQYPPGSTIKPFYAMAALEYHMPEATNGVHCRGYYQLPGDTHRFRDWKKEGHGAVDIDRAITESCDVFFYTLAANMGIDRMSQFLGYFGFGARTGIDIPNEFTGLLPSRAWKRKARKDNWYTGESVSMGIGQGYLSLTPLQLSANTAALSIHGVRRTPRVVHSFEDPDTNELQAIDAIALPSVPVQTPENWSTVITAMTHVIHGARGTAKGISKDITYTAAGKTGTAQVFGLKQDEKYKESEVAKKLRDHAWFMAFAPADNPRIAIAVIVENGGHGGSTAAPVARKVLDAYLVPKPAS